MIEKVIVRLLFYAGCESFMLMVLADNNNNIIVIIWFNLEGFALFFRFVNFLLGNLAQPLPFRAIIKLASPAAAKVKSG